MKPVSMKAAKVIDKLVAGLDQPGDAKTFDAHDYTKNWNGGTMAVHVENIGHYPSTGTGKLYSVAHYYKQNGDLLADPEMIFWAAKTRDRAGRFVDTYYPTYFKQDPIMEEESAIFQDGKLHSFYPRLQADHTRFANMWMNNIKEQQNL